MEEQKTILENKLIVNHLNDLEKKGLIGIVKPIESYWRDGVRDLRHARNVYQVEHSIYYHVYPSVEPFDMSTWDLTKPECLNIYLNWHNDFLKTLKPEEILFEDNNRRSDGCISMREFKIESRWGDITTVYFGSLNLQESIGNVIDYGFRILKLDDIHNESIIDVGKEKMTLNKLVHFDERKAGEIVRDSYISLYPNKQYAETPPYSEIPGHYFEIPVKKEK